MASIHHPQTIARAFVRGRGEKLFVRAVMR